MSLFSTLAPGQGYGQGASSIQLIGMDAVMRKGGAGKVPDHAVLSKSAAIRTIQDGFNIQNVSNVDLILRRKAPSSAESMRNAAGSVPSERRRPDVPAVIRETSLEHAVHRRHSAPPARQQRGEHNLMVRLSDVTEDANRIGCRIRNRQRSRSPNRSSSPIETERKKSPKRVRSQSPRKLETIVWPSIVDNVVRQSSACTWGNSHVFEGLDEPFIEVSEETIILCNQDFVDKTAAFKARSYSGWGSDDGRSTATGGSSPTRMLSSSTFCDCPTPRSLVSNLGGSTPLGSGFGGSTPLASGFGGSAPLANSFGGRGLVNRCGEMYERRMAALVKAEQKKAMRKVAK